LRGRDLQWEGCLIVRDLGGHRTADGGETRFGALVRADSIRRLTPAGWEALVAYGVRRVADLRFHSELAADPPTELPVDVVHVPVLPGLDEPQWQEIDTIGDAADDGDAAARAVYLEWLERFRRRFARAVTEASRGPEIVLVDCLGGKDRTGLVVALLLRLAGASPAAIAADDALSADNPRLRIDPWIAQAPDELERARRRRTAYPPARAMEEVVIEFDRRYGSARDYLLAGGVDEAGVERARALLRG
jgi:protein-tyrosine phosphatase